MLKANVDWLINLRYVEKNGANFFATGNSTTVVGLDLNYIPHVKGKGVNLSNTGQTLQQSYLTAKSVFEHVKPNTIAFVLIAVEPYTFPCDTIKDFSTAARDLQYDFAFKASDDNTSSPLNKDDIDKLLETASIDLNCEQARENFRQKFPEKMLINSTNSKLSNDDKLKENSKILQDYAKLCFDNGARPVFVTFPVELTLRKTYNADVLKHFRETIKAAGKNYKSVFIDFLDIKLADNYFYGKSHLNSTGATAITALLSARLYFNGLIPIAKICDMDSNYFNVLSKYFPNDYKELIHHVFCRMASDDFKRLSETEPQSDCKDLMARIFSDMTYNHLAKLSVMLPKDDYNDLAARIFKISAEKIRSKSKIKVGFCFNYSAAWCGDELFNFFARDERFEPTIFFRSKGNKTTREREYSPDLKRFKEHGLNIAEVDYNSKIPAQDVLIQLSPYWQYDPYAFHLINLKVTTLLAYIPYTFGILRHTSAINDPFFRVLWKMFFASTTDLEIYQKESKIGMPRGVYSGYPKMDIFFSGNSDFKFDWKLARPDAKKIIWAPHHTVGLRGEFSTFRWNYQFMYEFAKAHPEISWVVKPHPNLIPASIREKIFSSEKEVNSYFKKWDALPNAQVYMGAYYQMIFATSDGMIQDCASFIAEYQYVDKPMIYLTTGRGKFNTLGEEILKASYLVDGQDLDGIAAMMQKVFIEGDDYKAAERKAIFDKYLNYMKNNGMLASEFIYKSIAETF